MAEDAESWKSQAFRTQVRMRVDEAIKNIGNPTQKSVPEMENHVFSKAKTKNEYLQLVAKLILHLRDFSNKNKPQVMQANMIGHPIQSSVSDPMSALQNLAGSQASNEIHQVPPSNLQENSIMGSSLASSAPITITMTPGGLQQVNVGPNQIQQQRMTMQQNGHQMNQMIVSQGPGAPHSQIQPRQPVMTSNLQMQLQRMRQPNANQGMMSVPNQGPVNEVFYQNQQQQQQQQQVSNIQQFQGNLVPQYQNNQNMMSSNQHLQQMGQMPPNAAISQQVNMQPMTPSPSSYINPSPVLHSPMSVGMMNQRQPGSIPQPTLNTPVMSAISSPAPRQTDEQAYLDKLKYLSKYIEPLRMMIARIDRDESMPNEKKKDLSKIKNLLEYISDSNVRCSMDTLLKCEQVLERMDFKFKGSESNVPTAQPVVPKLQDHNIGQPLIDALINNIKKPHFNHTLHRTFGPAVAALIDCNYRPPSPARKMRKIEEPCEIPELLQGEIARLDQRFKVQLDPLQHPGSKSIKLICRLDDINLPCVPPISVKVPDGYPTKPPLSLINIEEYASSNFLTEIYQAFDLNISQLPCNYTLSSLLHSWEMSVRQACY